MKKFSKITNSFTADESKLVKEENPINEFKHEVMKLMNDFLSIQSYGSARPEIMIPTRIVGKEMFIEALTDLLSKSDNTKNIEILESLKHTNPDWKSIDDKITEINNNKRNLILESKINNIINKYNNDESIKIYIESVFKSDNKDEITEMISISNSLFKNTKNSLYKSVRESLVKKLI